MALLIYYEGNLVDAETRWARSGAELTLFGEHSALSRGMVLQVQTTSDTPLRSALVQLATPEKTVLWLEAPAAHPLRSPRGNPERFGGPAGRLP